MQELISPHQSEFLVVLFAGVLILCGRVFGARGNSINVLGLLLWVLWQGHKWITRYDSKSDYFGLDSVKVLALEVVVFIALGVALAMVWNKTSKQNSKGN